MTAADTTPDGRARGTDARAAYRGFMAVAGATFRETLQEPICLLLTLCAVGLTLALPLMRLHQFGEEGRMARDGGLAFMLLFGLLLAGVTAGRTMSREIERGTAAAMLSKPVSRELFLVAKFLGVLGVVGVFWLAALVATLLAERISEHFVFEQYGSGQVIDTRTAALAVGLVLLALLGAGWRNFRGGRFGLLALPGVVLALLVVAGLCGLYTSTGRWGGYHVGLNLRVIPAALLVGMLLTVFVSIAVALTTRLTAGPAVMCCLLLLWLGLLGEHAAAAGGGWGCAARLIPNVQYFWQVDAVARGGRIACAALARVALHAACCCGLALSLGGWAFKNRDLG